MDSQEIKDLWFGEVKTQGFECDFEFVIINSLVFVKVEEAKLILYLVMDLANRMVGRAGAYGFIYLFSLLVCDVVERC